MKGARTVLVGGKDRGVSPEFYLSACKGNFKPVVEAVKEKLKQNNFTWVDNGPETYEPETEFFHVPINFYITKERI